MTEQTAVQYPQHDPAAVLAAALHLTRVGLCDVEGIGEHLSCSETAALGALYVAAGFPSTADALAEGHTEEDHPDQSCSEYMDETIESAAEVLARVVGAPQAGEGDHPEDHEYMPEVEYLRIGEGAVMTPHTRARCSCGWESPYSFTVEADAADAFDAHLLPQGPR